MFGCVNVEIGICVSENNTRTQMNAGEVLWCELANVRTNFFIPK